jgi:glycosyltransferase involved in cell wall biosynthesis
VVLIDDGSTDATRARMEELCDRHPGCSLVVNPSNLGVGRSVLRAYSRVPPGGWVTAVPGDNELDFSSIDAFLAMRAEYDVILGYLQNPVIRTLSRRLASFAFGKVIKTLYGFPWRYLNGLKLYRVDAFRDLEIVSGGHAFVAELLAKAQLRQPHLRIGEAPFVARGRARGNSKAIRPGSVLRAIRDVFSGMRSVTEYRRRLIRGGDGFV